MIVSHLSPRFFSRSPTMLGMYERNAGEHVSSIESGHASTKYTKRSSHALSRPHMVEDVRIELPVITYTMLA
jgi:hypothetical protein